MNSRKVRFTGSQSTDLAAILNTPDTEPPAAYALFAHCFTCGKEFKAVVNISKALVAKGIAVFRFDFTGLGESEGEFSDTTFSSNVEDLIAAAEYMKSTYAGPQLLIGHSFGGTAVIRAAERIENCRAVATIAAAYDPSLLADRLNLDERFEDSDAIEVTIAGRAFRLKRQFLEDIRDEKLKGTIGTLRKPLIIFHSPVDNIVGIDNAGKIFQAAKHPKSFISLDDADHVLSDPNDSKYVGNIIAEWAAKYIR